MKKRFIKIFLILIFEIMLVAVSIYGTYLYLFHNSRYYDLIKYEEKLLRIDLEDYIEDMDGCIILDESEFAEVKFRVAEGREEDILSLFDEEFGQRMTPDPLPVAAPVTFYEMEINEKTPQHMYELLLPGTHGQMTRDVRIFVVWEQDEDMYIYLFG